MPFLISPDSVCMSFLNGRTSALRHVTRELAYTSSGRRRSAASKLGWLIVGRRIVVVDPQTTRNGVVAIDPHTTRSGVAWDHSSMSSRGSRCRSGPRGKRMTNALGHSRPIPTQPSLRIFRHSIPASSPRFLSSAIRKASGLPVTRKDSSEECSYANCQGFFRKRA
jgi:hypothetical protein